jgi:hypothetical protein
MIQLRNVYMKARVVFVIQGCPRCAKYKEFVERFNLELPINKRIRVVDATNFNSLGIVDNPLIDLFDKYIPDSFPVLFLDGMRISYANSREEAEAFVRGYLHKEFIIPRENQYMFNKKCKVVPKGFFKKPTIICEERGE